ncbi:hypothetical protein [Primorskyibacter sp. S87]|uniref:hypothetical protein n=1 Tax=Primorskyibacter sp. S87 TaxID=3415126 RepID=UPI003C7B18DC
MTRSRTFLLTAALALVATSLSGCMKSTGSARVHAGIGYSPYWRYYDRPPIVIPPDPDFPEVELPIAPEPPIAVPLPSFPEPDIGGGFGGDIGGGDFGGADLF